MMLLAKRSLTLSILYTSLFGKISCFHNPRFACPSARYHSLARRLPCENQCYFEVENLPIFPLRKRCILPTETLTLNLYEDRYLKLAERVLERSSRSNNPALLGAFFSNQKPQILAYGQGPIVPLLDPGDVGVICVVNQSQENMVPTRDGVGNRRSIRLECTAVAVAELKAIISNGYNDSLPFIVSCVEIMIGRGVTNQGDLRVHNDTKIEEEWRTLIQNLTNTIGHTVDIELIRAHALEMCKFSILSSKIPQQKTLERLDVLGKTKTAKSRADR